jgi:hypothetical protein
MSGMGIFVPKLLSLVGGTGMGVLLKFTTRAP